MEEWLYPTRLRVDSSQVRTFMKVAAMACKRETIGVIRAAMLPRSDVFDVMDRHTIRLVKSAILAVFAGPLTDETSRPGIHSLTDSFQMSSGL